MVPKLVTSLLAVLLLAACTTTDGDGPLDVIQAKDPLTITPSVPDGSANVEVDTLVHVDGFDGELTDVSLVSHDGEMTVPGAVHGIRWTAEGFLEPATKYVLKASGTGDDGEKVSSKTTFTTRALTLDEQTYPAVGPLQGETVGVAMPVIVSFDIPVTDRASFEKRMSVTAQPATKGGWYWLSDNKAHWRPKSFWKPGTKVSVDLALNSVPAGNGIYGQQDQHVKFTVGRSVVTVVNTRKHTATVKVNGKKARTIAVSTGDADHRSRNGVKVVMEKHASIDMDAASTGVDADAPDYYNLKGVKWALRVTNSGEFLHAAPWSAAQQGNANVSHGCVGMSTADAAWLYKQTKRGDVVKYVGSPRKLEPGNGWTDWNRSWADWLEGSALSPAADSDA